MLIMCCLPHLSLSQRFSSGSVRYIRPLSSFVIWSPFISAINDFFIVDALVSLWRAMYSPDIGCLVGSFARTSIRVRDCGVSEAYTDVNSDVSLATAVFTAPARSSAVGIGDISRPYSSRFSGKRNQMGRKLIRLYQWQISCGGATIERALWRLKHIAQKFPA